MGETGAESCVRLAPGDPLRVRFQKWGGGAHWSADVVWLGEDEHGWWAGWPPGTRWTRPGTEFSSHGRQVGLFPRERGFAATFYEPVAEYRYRLYVDVATTPTLAVRAAEAERDRLLRELADEAAHFRESLAEHWRARLDALT